MRFLAVIFVVIMMMLSSGPALADGLTVAEYQRMSSLQQIIFVQGLAEGYVRGVVTAVEALNGAEEMRWLVRVCGRRMTYGTIQGQLHAAIWALPQSTRDATQINTLVDQAMAGWCRFEPVSGR